ncbi:MAG: M15 family metallopeptidase [Acutalibacteraceae bacterium]|nr:M15 family metallopeptidase [Acutalibacteraceae bacterium]
MNKKITPRVIRIIALQSVMVILAVTALGGAVITHQKYKGILENPGSESVSTQDGTTLPVSDEKTPDETTSSTSGTEAPTQGTSAPDPNQYPYAYAGFLPKVTDVNADLSKLIVNGKYSLPANYKPQLAEAVKGSGVYLDYRVAPYYQQMYDAALKDGITLTPISGYRSYDRQKNNFENRIKEHMNSGMDKVEATKKAATVIMVPGSSEHNAGLAMDICSLAESFENYKEFQWLDEHAHEYGFILRYPKDERSKEITGVVYEPWHYRYVGVDTAKEIKSKGITLEEYVGVA